MKTMPVNAKIAFLNNAKWETLMLFVTWKGKASIEMLRIVIVNGELHNGQD